MKGPPAGKRLAGKTKPRLPSSGHQPEEGVRFFSANLPLPSQAVSLQRQREGGIITEADRIEGPAGFPQKQDAGKRENEG